MTATLDAATAASLELAVVGDQAELEVTAVNPDGSVEVSTEADSETEDAGEGEDMPAMTGMMPGSENPVLGRLKPSGMMA